MHGDSPVPNRTLLGVMPDDMARALAAARETSPAAPAARGGTAPARAAQRPVPAAVDPGAAPVRAGGTMMGAAVPAAVRASAARAPAMPTVFEGPPAAPEHGSGARGKAEPPAIDQGTVRSVTQPPRHPTHPLMESLDIAPDDFEPPDDDEEEKEGAELPLHARTHLGVAIPGVAPLHAGARGGAGTARAAATPLAATQLQVDSLTEAPTSGGAGMPRGAFVLLGSGLALLLAAGIFALLWQAPKPISVSISADASGKDRIDLVCEECPDGTLVRLDQASAEISARKAYLSLPEPLPLGENRVSFGLQRPGATEPELVELTLPPVDYRIRPDTSTLVGDQPRLTLKIAAVPGSKVELAGQPVALDGAGLGEIAVDLSGQLIGPASEVTTFEQGIAYSIAPPSGKVYEGELAFKIGVTPLLLEAPGVDTVTDLERFMLAGRTTKGAELWVAGTTIAVDGNGRFAQLMSIDSVGETRVTVRATEPGLAPRFASFRLQRVQNLEGEAAARRQKATPLADVAGNIADHVGSTVVVSGRVEEARVDGHRTLVILQAEGDCQGRSCLARLVYGGLRKLARGEAITAIGRLQGAVSTPHAAGGGAEVPEVDVSLLL
jgi:hypothetical protein